ncbi:hypothetical protein TNCV_3937671 [Trichonephila clavipes]|nr:hypothetical protein TNCV_3937671 [Trichonephila clavipes]
MIDLAQFHPNFEEENPGCGQGPLTSLPLPPTSREDLWFDGYLEYPQTTKALYTDKRSCLLGDLNPGAMAKQSASQTIEPDERYCKNLKRTPFSLRRLMLIFSLSSGTVFTKEAGAYPCPVLGHRFHLGG